MGVRESLTACLDSLVRGEITCAKALPIGFMTAMNMVAVVLPRKSNHSSLYFAGRIWKIAWEMLAKNFRIIWVSYLGPGDARGHGTHLADDEERVGSVTRERPCSASVPNPCGENQADGTKVALKRSDPHKLTLQGSLVEPA